MLQGKGEPPKVISRNRLREEVIRYLESPKSWEVRPGAINLLRLHERQEYRMRRRERLIRRLLYILAVIGALSLSLLSYGTVLYILGGLRIGR